MKKINHLKKYIKVLFRKINLGNFLLIVTGILTGIFIFQQIDKERLTFSNVNSIISSILTINGVFSAILITYLFTRITWTKDRKLEIHNEAISLSQKITEFRRILKILTTYYNVWESDKSTKSLLDHNDFKHIDFYDFRLASISEYKPDNLELIEKLRKDPRFFEGQSVLYLAMDSLVKQRKRDYYWQEELYKDFEHKGIYNKKAIEKWIECEIMDTISYWLSDNYQMINFHTLREHKEFIISA